MPDNTPSAAPTDTTTALSHLAFCALVALGLARQDGIVSTPYAENLFLICFTVREAVATAPQQEVNDKTS